MKELQKLKSMVNNLEEKNNILLWKLEPSSGGSPVLQRQFFSTGPNFYPVDKISAGSTSKDRFDVLSAQNPRSANFFNTTAATSDIHHRPQHQGQIEEIRRGPSTGGRVLTEEGGTTRQLEARLKDTIGLNQVIMKENEEWKSKYNRLKSLYESEVGIHEDLKRGFEARDMNVLRDLDTMLGDSKLRIDRFTTDFLHFLESKLSRRSETTRSSYSSAENDFLQLKGFVLERLRDLERGIMKMGAYAQQSLGTVPSKETLKLEARRISQTSLSKERSPYLNTEGSITTSPKMPYSQKMGAIQSPVGRHREMDHVLDSLTKKKNEVFQSIRGLEDSLYPKKTGLESQYNSRSRTEGSAKDDFETRYSIVRGITCFENKFLITL